MNPSLPLIRKDWNKYSRGFLLGFGGSKEFQGAIKLSGRASLNSGAGITRLFSFDEIGPFPDELIFQVWEKNIWEECLEKASAVMVGPGMGRSFKNKEWLKNYLPLISLPMVIDADALFFLKELDIFPPAAILTPHEGELIHLLGGKKDSLLKRAQDLASEKDIILLLKGPSTHIFSQAHQMTVIEEADPCMATAGSGDVLTGIIGALLAQKMKPLEASILGAKLHGLAGMSAAKAKTSYCVTASDLIEHLPLAFKKIIG